MKTHKGGYCFRLYDELIINKKTDDDAYYAKLYLPPSFSDLHPLLKNAKFVVLYPETSQISTTTTTTPSGGGGGGGGGDEYLLASLHWITDHSSSSSPPPPPPPRLELPAGANRYPPSWLLSSSPPSLPLKAVVVPLYLFPPIRILLLCPVKDNIHSSLLPPPPVALDHIIGAIIPNTTTTATTPKEEDVVVVVMMEDLHGNKLPMYAKAFATAPTYDHKEVEEEYMKEVKRWCYVNPSTTVLVQGGGGSGLSWRCPRWRTGETGDDDKHYHLPQYAIMVGR